MRRVTLAARRASQFLRRPPRPALVPAGALCRAARSLALAVGLGAGLWATSSGALERLATALAAQALAVTVDAGLAVREVFVDGRAAHRARRAAGAARHRAGPAAARRRHRPRASASSS